MVREVWLRHAHRLQGFAYALLGELAAKASLLGESLLALPRADDESGDHDGHHMAPLES